MRLGERKSIKLTHRSDKFGISLEDLIEKLTVVNMVSTSRSSSVPTIGTCRRCIHQKLRFINHFEIDGLVYTILIFSFLSILVQWKRLGVKLSVFIEEVLSGTGLAVLAASYHQRDIVILNIRKKLKHLLKSKTTLLFDGQLLRLMEDSLRVADSASSWSSGIFRMDSLPSHFECLLHLL